MKFLVRQLIISYTSLFLTSLLFSGLVITGGFVQFLYASILLLIGLLVVKPILTIITLPIGMLTLGLFSTILTMVVLFLINIVDSNLSIQAFQFPGFSFLFIVIPSFQANIFLSYVLISVTIQLIWKLFAYVFDL